MRCISCEVAIATERVISRIAESRIIHAVSFEDFYYSVSIKTYLSALLWLWLCLDSFSFA